MKKLFVFTLLGLCAVGAYAQKPLSFYASQEASYDDNIYLVNEDTFKDPYTPLLGKNEKTSSVISRTAVGFDYGANIPETALALAVSGKVGYNAYSEDSAKNSYTDGNAFVGIGNSIFNINNNFVYTEDPANSELTQRAKRISDAAAFKIKTSASKPLGVGLSVSNYLDKYSDDEFKGLSRNRIEGGLQLYYNISPKTNIYAEYIYSAISYSDADVNDSTSNTGAVGIEGQISAKLTGSAKATYESRKYDNKKEISSEYADDNASVAGYDISLTWSPTEQNAVSLSGRRTMEESQFGLSRYYVTTGVSLSLQQKIMDKLAASLVVAYENMAYPEDNPASWGAPSYPGENRTDNLLRLRPALDYKFQQWLSAGIWYQYRSKSSNQDTFEYSNNQAGAYVKVMF